MRAEHVRLTINRELGRFLYSVRKKSRQSIGQVAASLGISKSKLRSMEERPAEVPCRELYRLFKHYGPEQILLYPNKRFEVEINEKYILKYTDSGYAYKKMKSRVVSGTYSQSNGKLVLGDVIEIVGREVDKRVQANILYKKDVMSAGLSGRTVMGHMVWSTSAIKSERETCPNPEDTLGEFQKFQARADRSTIQLNALYSDQQIYANGFYIKNMRIILQNDGSYAIVAQGAAPTVGFVTTYIIDTGYWSRVNGSLKLYNGVLNLGFGDDEATLRFTRDLTVFANDKAYSLPMIGKSVSMKFYPSDLITDDLTDTYR